MKKILIFSSLLLITFATTAHPGIGIVKDSKGNIYYTDLKQVWKISLDGSRSAVVTGVHTHELFIDGEENLYGEHLWYNGEAADTWGHYVWCLKNNGELVKEIDPTEGFLTNYSFVRDSLGNMYWVERFTISRIMKKDRAGEIKKIAEGNFGFIGWLFCTKNGTLYFTAKNKLHKLMPRGRGSYEIDTIPENIGSRSTDFTTMGSNYNSYGIWTDTSENIYLAMIDSKKVIRIDAGGKSQIILETNSLWTICSGIFDNDGNLWVLENSATNDVRARKISKAELAGGTIARNSVMKWPIAITIFTGLAILVLLLIIKIILDKKKGNQFTLLHNYV